jgi:hypothetical protein
MLKYFPLLIKNFVLYLILPLVLISFYPLIDDNLGTFLLILLISDNIFDHFYIEWFKKNLIKRIVIYVAFNVFFKIALFQCILYTTNFFPLISTPLVIITWTLAEKYFKNKLMKEQ